MERLVDNIYTFKGKVENVENDYIIKVQEKLKSLEDKQKQGLLIELPVPLGTMVFCIDTEWEDDGNYYFIHEYRFRVDMLDEWGKWVFATRSEAEEALAKMGEREHDKFNEY